MKICGAPGEIRTPDPLVRSQVLYPTELRARRVKLLRGGGPRPSRRVSQRAAHSKGRREIRPDKHRGICVGSLRPGYRPGNAETKARLERESGGGDQRRLPKPGIRSSRAGLTTTQPKTDSYSF